MPKKDENTEVEETETEEVEEEVEQEDDDNDSDNWERMKSLVDNAVSEGLSKWQQDKEAAARKRMTSSDSRKKVASKRKQGFLSGGFFSGLTDDK